MMKHVERQNQACVEASGEASSAAGFADVVPEMNNAAVVPIEKAVKQVAGNLKGTEYWSKFCNALC